MMPVQFIDAPENEMPLFVDVPDDDPGLALAAENHRMLQQARGQLDRAGQGWKQQGWAVLDQIRTGIESRSARLGGELRGTDVEADRLVREGNAMAQAIAERDPEGFKGFALRSARGAAVTLPEMVVEGATLGPYGAIMGAVSQESNQAITEGKDAGLSGGELARYVAAQGAVEALPAVVMQRLGLGGLESAVGRQAVSKGVMNGLKRAGIQTLQELPEEIVTELGHSLTGALAGTRPDALKPEQLMQTIADTVGQTLVTMGLVETPQIRQAAIVQRQRAQKLAQWKQGGSATQAITGVQDNAVEGIAALDAPPGAHKWAEIVLGDRKRFKEAPDEATRQKQWEDIQQEISDAEKVYRDQGGPTETGQVGQGGEVDRRGDVYQGGQVEESPQPTGEVATAPEVPVAPESPDVAELNSMSPEALAEIYQAVFPDTPMPESKDDAIRQIVEVWGGKREDTAKAASDLAAFSQELAQQEKPSAATTTRMAGEQDTGAVSEQGVQPVEPGKGGVARPTVPPNAPAPTVSETAADAGKPEGRKGLNVFRGLRAGKSKQDGWLWWSPDRNYAAGYGDDSLEHRQVDETRLLDLRPLMETNATISGAQLDEEAQGLADVFGLDQDEAVEPLRLWDVLGEDADRLGKFLEENGYQGMRWFENEGEEAVLLAPQQSPAAPQTPVSAETTSGPPQPAETQQETPQKPQTPSAPDYSGMKGKELAAEAKKRGLKGFGGKKKDALRAMLEEDDRKRAAPPRTVGARKATPEGLQRVEAAKERLREIVNNKDLTGKTRADAIANGKALVGFLTATADTRKPLDTDYRNGDQIAYTGVTTPDGFREFIYLEGSKAGQYGQAMTEAEVAANRERKATSEAQLQEGFRRLRETTTEPTPAAETQPDAAQEAADAIQDMDTSTVTGERKAMQAVADIAQKHGLTPNELWRDVYYDIEGGARDIESILKSPLPKTKGRPVDKPDLSRFKDEAAVKEAYQYGKLSTGQAIEALDRIRAAAKESTTPEPIKPPLTSQERWDSAKLGKRIEWLQRAGWTTAKGQLSKRAERWAEQSWNKLSPASRNALESKIAEDYPRIERETEKKKEVAESTAPAAEKQPWEMTREEFFNDPDLVRSTIPEGSPGFRVKYRYTTPGPGGPFAGEVTMSEKPKVGDTVPAMFGAAKVTSVSKAKPAKMDNMQLFQQGKVAHRQLVADALSAGKPIPDSVLAEYPDLKPSPATAAATEPKTTTEPSEVPETREGAVQAAGMQPDGQIRTVSGRMIDPPKQKVTATAAGVKRNVLAVDTWLVQAGIEEAELRGDEFNGDQFRRINPKKITTAERDGLNLYLFGKEEISLTKPSETTQAAKPELASDTARIQAEREAKKAAKQQAKERVSTEGYAKLPEKTRTKFESAWEGTDSQAMKSLLDPANKALRAEFERRSNRKLPRTIKGTDQLVDQVYAERKPAPAAEKQPWEMTKEEFTQKYPKTSDANVSPGFVHRHLVTQAVAEGKPVPDFNLVAYNLKPPTAPAAATEAETAPKSKTVDEIAAERAEQARKRIAEHDAELKKKQEDLRDRQFKQDQERLKLARPVVQALESVEPAAGGVRDENGLATNRTSLVFRDAIDGKFTKEQLSEARLRLRSVGAPSAVIDAIESAKTAPESQPTAGTKETAGQPLGMTEDEFAKDAKRVKVLKRYGVGNQGRRFAAVEVDGKRMDVVVRESKNDNEITSTPEIRRLAYRKLQGEMEAKQPSALSQAAEAANKESAEAGVSGEASKPTNRPSIQPQPGSASGAMLQPVQMPELFQLATDLMAGKIPQVKPLRGAAGRFKAQEGIGPLAILIDPSTAKDEQALAQTLAHEIGHLVDFLPDNTLKRGNLLGRLQSMRSFLHSTTPTLSAKDQARLRRDARRVAGGKNASKQDVEAAYQQLLKSQGFLANSGIKQELIDLTKWWSGDYAGGKDSYVKYRESSRELYAEALSVFLNSPGDLETRAPEFYHSLLDNLNSKPDVLQAYSTLQQMLNGTGQNLAEARTQTLREMFGRAEEHINSLRTAEEHRRKSAWAGMVDFLGQYFLTSAQPVFTKIGRKPIKRGGLAEAEAARFALDELFTIDSPNHTFLRNLDTQVYQPLIEVMQGRGLDRKAAEAEANFTLGEYLFHWRVANERDAIANPAGFSATPSQSQLEAIRTRIGDVAYAKLELFAGQFHDLVYAVAEEAAKEGVYNRNNFDNVITPNKDNYAAFRVTHYIDDPDVIATGVIQQVGTFSDIQNPFHSTVLKVVRLNRLIELNRAKNRVRVLLEKDFPADIKPVEMAFVAEGRPRVPKRRPAKGKDHLVELVDGHPVYYEVPIEIAKTFSMHDIGGLGRIAALVNSATYKVFHPFFVTYNPGFVLANPFRDLRRTWVNLGATDNIPLRKLLYEWAKALPVAVRRQKGLEDSVIQDMIDNHALDIPYTAVTAEEIDSQIDQLFQKYGLREKPKRRLEKIPVIGKTLELIEHAGAMTETATKVAGWRVLEQAGVPVQERSYRVRKYVGTPDYKQRGLATALTNSMMMYSRVRWNGLQADISLATNPETAAGWWWRQVVNVILPTSLAKMAAYGAFGYALRAMFGVDDDDDDTLVGKMATWTDETGKRVAKYFLTDYDVLPLGVNRDGKAVFITIPRDDLGKFIARTWWHATDLVQLAVGGELRDSDGVRNVVGGEFVDVKENLIPSLSPPLEIANKWLWYGAGVNPIDSFYNQQIVPYKEWSAGGWAADSKMIAWTLDEFGAPGAIIHYAASPLLGETYETGTSGGVEGVMKTVGSATGLKRFLRVSDSGLTNHQWAMLENADQEAAAFRLSLPKAAQEASTRRYFLMRREALGDELSDKERRERYGLDMFYSAAYLPLRKMIQEAEDAGDASDTLRSDMEQAAKDPIALWDTPPDSLADTVESYKQSVVLAAVESPPDPDKYTAEVYAEKKMEYEKILAISRARLKVFGPSHAEAQQLLVESYRKPDSKGKMQTEINASDTTKFDASYWGDAKNPGKAKILAKLYGYSDPAAAVREFRQSPEFKAWLAEWNRKRKKP